MVGAGERTAVSMEVLVCLLVAGAAMGRQQAVSYQNFRASHGQGHPTYGADGSWSQRFGGAPQGLPALAKDLPVLRPFTNHHTNHQRFNSFPSGQTFHQSHQTHQQQPFFNSHRPQTHIHTSGPPPPPPPQLNTYQSSHISYEPQNIPGNQNLINSAGPHVYQSPTVSSYGPEVTHSSPLPPQSYGNDRLPQFSDGIHPSYNRGLINTQPPALQEQPNYPTNGPIESSYEPRPHDDYPRNDGPPTPIYNDYNEGPRIESSPPSYSPEPSQPSYQPQNNGNSYSNEGSYHNYDEPKRDFGPASREPIAPTPGPYNGPGSDLRSNNEAPISEPRPPIESRPNPDLRSNDRPPITEHRAHNEERPSELRNNNERPPSELRNFDERPPHTELRAGNGPGPGPDSRPPTERPVSELRSNFNERPSSPEIRFNSDSRPGERPADRQIDRPNKEKSPLSPNLRHESGRSSFGGSSFQSSFGPTSDTIKPTPQSVTSKQFKPHQPPTSPLDRPQGGGPNNRVSPGPSSTLGPSSVNSVGPVTFNRDEKKPSSDTGFTKKDEFNSDGKPDFSEEDKSQSFESEFQSAEIGGQSFEADIPDFGSDESYFNSQEGYGSFESSGEAKGSYERPSFNSNEEKRNNFKSERGPDFQSSSETSRGQEDGPPEPRNNQKLRNEAEGRHRGGEDKKSSIEEKKGPFSPLEKKPAARVSGAPDKGFPPGRPSPGPSAAKDTVPLANTFNKKVPYVAPFRPSSYNGDKFSQFVPIEKPFQHRNRGSYGAESRLDYQFQLPDKKISNFIEKYISPSSIIKNVPVNK